MRPKNSRLNGLPNYYNQTGNFWESTLLGRVCGLVKNLNKFFCTVEMWRERLGSLSGKKLLYFHFNRSSSYNRDVDGNNSWKQNWQPPVSMEFPPSPIIYSEAIFQEKSQPACKSVFKKIALKGWWNNSSPQISGGQVFLPGYPVCVSES